MSIPDKLKEIKREHQKGYGDTWEHAEWLFNYVQDLLGQIYDCPVCHGNSPRDTGGVEPWGQPTREWNCLECGDGQDTTSQIAARLLTQNQALCSEVKDLRAEIFKLHENRCWTRRGSWEGEYAVATDRCCPSCQVFLYPDGKVPDGNR